MWPSVRASRPFGDATCPGGVTCEIPFCLFSHDAPNSKSVVSNQVKAASGFEGERETKRRKLYVESNAPLSSSNVVTARAEPAVAVPVGARPKEAHHPARPHNESNGNASGTTNGKAVLPRTATRPVSPPKKPAEKKSDPKPDPPVSLVPRKLAKDPEQWAKRLSILRLLHELMVIHNEEVGKSDDKAIKELKLSGNRLKKLAVDEEAKVAEEHQTVYRNVINQRLMAVKKMGLAGWVKERQGALKKEEDASAKARGEVPIKPPPEPVKTGLSGEGEVAMLANLICDQTGLDAHGYVTRQPTEEDLENTRQVLVSASGWEKCERCNTRFQVFPDRREEDGALTTGGSCRHHWGKKIFPKRQRTEVGTTRWSCCQADLGSDGCTTGKTHVFGVKDPKRLSLIMPFVETPRNDNVPPHTAICFDCEMGSTTNGLELLRITATAWPTHKPVLDILVRPLGHILDLNTRFSGVTAEQFANAKPYDPDHPVPVQSSLRIVDSPYIARDLFLSHISPSTPLLGHALENDLNSIRIIHPNIVDTALLFPHPKGLPIRNSLRGLVKTHLNMDIQQAGSAGHDSYEDAMATGELIRYKVMQEVMGLKADGWTVQDGEMYPPLPNAAPSSLLDDGERMPVAGEKRKLSVFENGEMGS